MATENLGFKVEVAGVDGGTVTIALAGELDIASAPELREALLNVVNQPRLRVTLDLTALEFIDSTGIGVIVGAWRRLQAQDGSLELTNARPRVADAIQLVGLDRLLKHED